MADLSPTVQAPPKLEMFASRSLRFIRVVDKSNSGGGTSKRVLCLSGSTILLARLSFLHPKGRVRRFVTYDKVRSIRVQQDSDGVPQALVQFGASTSEHDILIRFDTFPENATLTADAMDAAVQFAELARDNARASLDYDLRVDVDREKRGSLAPYADLIQRPGFVRPYDMINETKAAMLEAKRKRQVARATEERAASEQQVAALRTQVAEQERALDAKQTQLEEKERAFLAKEAEAAAAPVSVQELSSVNDGEDPLMGAPFGSHGGGGGSGGRSPRYLPHAPPPGARGGYGSGRAPQAPRVLLPPHSQGSSLPYTPLHPQESVLRTHKDLDYWTRFVLRWEAEGQAAMESI
eukprot:Rhum_TRINITY_DN14713_c1_g1::Rhum_TRINITY_DN14713_c1_g1_i1::g.111451::m.111451